MTGKLYLIPTPISDQGLDWVIPSAVQNKIRQLSHFIVEHPKTARQFLKLIGSNIPLQAVDMGVLDEHTLPRDYENLLQPLLDDHDVGLLSEAGCPAIADPGAGLVRLAHQRNIQVVPLVGPSSILLALMASGLNGQSFSFVGYLPIEADSRMRRIAALEKLSVKYDQTQIFIETPYRNQKLLEQILSVCQDETVLCMASLLTSPVKERIMTRSIKLWREVRPDIDKIPAIFLLHG